MNSVIDQLCISKHFKIYRQCEVLIELLMLTFLVIASNLAVQLFPFSNNTGDNCTGYCRIKNILCTYCSKAISFNKQHKTK